MSTKEGQIAVDEVFEAATMGVLRALESRDIAGREFTRENGFYVRIDLTAGGWPIALQRAGLQGLSMENIEREQ